MGERRVGERGSVDPMDMQKLGHAPTDRADLMKQKGEANELRRRIRDLPDAARHAPGDTVHLTLTPERLAFVRP